MKPSLIQLICIAFLVFTQLKCIAEDPNNLKLWYTKPAQKWTEALPIGNGRLGAMIYGGVDDDQIQFNEETLWTGSPNNYAHKGAYRYLGQIRQLLFDGKQKDAEDLAMQEFMSVPIRQCAYQAFGTVNIHFQNQAEYRNYRRELDLTKAIQRVSYQSNGVNFSREYLSSNPDQVIDRKSVV